MALVENFEDRGPVEIGVGLEEDYVALYAAGVEHIVAPAEVMELRRFGGFRAGDTLIIARPKLLRPESYRALAELAGGGASFCVVGHEPVPLNDAASVEAFRATKAIVTKSAPVVMATGRKSSVAYSLEQAEAILRAWYSGAHPVDVTESAEEMLNLEPGTLTKRSTTDPSRWVKDLAIKYTGSAARKPPAGWRGIEVDADGRNVRYWKGQGDG